MDRTFDIAFRISGELSGSFSSALAAAQRQMSDLNRRIGADTQRNLSQAARTAQNLERLYAAQNAINQYKDLNQRVQQNSAALMQARLRTAQLRQEHAREQQQLEQMRQSYDQLKTVYRENQRSMSADERVAMQSQIRAAREELREQERRTREAGSAAVGSNREQETLTRRLHEQQQQLAQLRSSLTAAGVSLSEMAAHEQELQDAINRTTQELERQNQIDFARQRHADAQTNMSYAYDNFQNAIGTARTIMSPFVDAVKTSMQFNKAMSEVEAVTGATGAEFDSLKAKAQELGASTMFSASESAEAMKFLGMAGFQVNDILGSMPAMLSLAAAGNTDLARTADILSDGLTAFKMQANELDSTRFADVMAATVSKSNTSVELMGETFKYAGAVAGSLGYSIEDVALATGLMANASVKGSMAGTALRSTFTRLVSPPKDAAAALQALGVTAVNADGTMKPFRQTLLDLRAAFKNLTAAEKAEYAAKIAGLEAQAGFLAMVDATDDSFNELMNNIDNSQGMAAKMAQVQSDNLEGAVKTFESAFEGIQIAVGDVFEEPLKNLVNSLATGLQSLTQWVSKNRELVVIAGQVAAAISGIIIAVAGFGVVSTAIEYVAASFSLLKLRVLESVAALRAMSFASITSQISSMATSLASVGRAAMGFAFSPIGIALMALAAAGYYCYTHWSQVAPVFESLAATLGGSLQGAITAISSSLENLGTSVSRLGPAFAQIGGAIFSGLAVALNFAVNIGATFISTFSNAIAAVISLFGGLGNAIASALAGDWNKAAEHFKNAFVNAGKFIVEAIKSLFGGLADTFTNFFKPLEIMHGFTGEKATSGGGSFGTPQPQQTQQVDNSALIAAISTAVESSRKENSNADFSKIESALSTAVESVKQDPKSDITPQLQAISTAIESVKKENPEADTAKLEAVLQSAMSQIQAAQKEKSDSAEIVQAVSTAIESLKQQNSDADFSKIEAAISAAVEKSGSSEQLAAAISTAIESTKQEQPELDLTPITEAIAAAQQAQAEQKNLEVEPVQEALNQAVVPFTEVGAATQMFNAEMTNAQAANAANNAEIQNSAAANAANNAQLQASQGALSGFNAALQSTNGGLASLASSSSSAASAISGLGSAASAAVSALQSAGANAAAVVSAAAANIGKPAANFKGGIYPRGEFLTTFAEKSPEAAIPIDNSRRAIDLWTKTGQLLGQLPGNSTAIESTPQAQKISTIEKAQRRRLEQVKAQYEAAKKLSTAIEYDELGNIKGLNGLKDNIITKDDDVQVTRAKKLAQSAEWRKKNSTRTESPRSIFSGRVQTSMPNILTTTQTLPKNLSRDATAPPFVPNSTRIESPRSIFSGRVQTSMPNILTTTQTQPQNYDTGFNIGNIFGMISDKFGGDGGGILSAITERLSASSSAGIIPQLINNLPQTQAESTSPIDLHFEINIAGNANAEDVEQGIRQTIPLLEETFERKLANFKHEEQRRSF